ncbi:MAG: hypothetical protein ACLQBD_21795 [Syntrophobacteraceae bacterium]
MQKGFDRNEIDDKLLWGAIIRVTERIGSEDIRALRMVLYFSLMFGGELTFRDGLRSYRKLWRWLILPPVRKIPKAAKGQPLFAFLFNTASNMNNLLPVFRAARKRGLKPGILMGERVTLHSQEFDNLTGLVSVYNLTATTKINEILLHGTFPGRILRNSVSSSTDSTHRWQKLSGASISGLLQN